MKHEQLTPTNPEAEPSTEIETTIGKIIIGDVIRIQYEDDPESERYRLIEMHDDNPDSPVPPVSIDTPLSKAVRGAHEGDTVIVKAPNGDYSVIILEVERAANTK